MYKRERKPCNLEISVSTYIASKETVNNGSNIVM